MGDEWRTGTTDPTTGQPRDPASSPSPLEPVRHWFDEAVAGGGPGAEAGEPRAMAFATVDAEGRPDVRAVIVRVLDAHGPGFVTPMDSAKGRAIRTNPAVAGTLAWPALFRAIRFRGSAVELERGIVAGWYASRSREEQLALWATRQSAPLGGRAELEEAYAAAAARFPESAGVPLPDALGGFRIRCDEVELWAGRRDGLHDRVVWSRTGDGDLGDAAAWRVHRRQP